MIFSKCTLQKGIRIDVYVQAISHAVVMIQWIWRLFNDLNQPNWHWFSFISATRRTKLCKLCHLQETRNFVGPTDTVARLNMWSWYLIQGESGESSEDEEEVQRRIREIGGKKHGPDYVVIHFFLCFFLKLCS